MQTAKNRSLTLSLRPHTFDQMIGVDKIIKRIRKRVQQGIDPAFMFVGSTGTGKTTIARILSVALQCEHQEVFGNPCKECRRQVGEFDITEINASDVRQVKELREAIEHSNSYPMPGSLYKVYIMDEAHQMSKFSQNLMLKFLEDSPDTTIWEICTTAPEELLDTFRTRCAIYELPPLGLEDVRKLVERGLQATGSDRDAEELIESLLEGRITSPRKVLRALEKYLAGATPQEAARVELGGQVDGYGICRSIIQGNWKGVAEILRTCKPEDAVPVKTSVTGYFLEVMINGNDFSRRANSVSKVILEMTKISQMEHSMQWAGVCALLYELTLAFAKERA